MPAIRRSSSRLLAKSGTSTPTSNGLPTPSESSSLNHKLKSTGRRTAKSILVKSELPTEFEDELQSAALTVPTTRLEPEGAFVPAVLTFDFEEAKRHLTQVDQRFEELFTKMKCKPFEHLEQVHPFR